MSAATYLSFVTITTLGYGDITPAFGLAASLAPVEALLGQIFMAALVARLVGLYTTQQHAGNE
jgi:voltage-gated potassium channel Kch